MHFFDIVLNLSSKNEIAKQMNMSLFAIIFWIIVWVQCWLMRQTQEEVQLKFSCFMAKLIRDVHVLHGQA